MDAVQVAEALMQSRYVKADPEMRREMSGMIAHFYCELAEEARQKSDKAAARKWLDKALQIDKSSLRAALIAGTLDNADQRYKQAVKVLSRAAAQNPDMLAECLPELFNAYVALDPVGGFNDILKYVETQVAQSPSTTAVLFMVDQLLHQSQSEPSRAQQAYDLLANYLSQNPSLAGLSKLIALQLPRLSDDVAGDVASLQSLVQQLLEKRLVYKCSNCGFAGRQLHWRCPSCKRWSCMGRVKGIEAD